MFVLRQRNKTVRDITLAVYQFMVKENLQVRLKEQEEEFQAEGELALAKEYAQVYRILVELIGLLEEDEAERRRIAHEVEREMKEMEAAMQRQAEAA